MRINIYAHAISTVKLIALIIMGVLVLAYPLEVYKAKIKEIVSSGG